MRNNIKFLASIVSLLNEKLLFSVFLLPVSINAQNQTAIESFTIPITVVENSNLDINEDKFIALNEKTHLINNIEVLSYDLKPYLQYEPDFNILCLKRNTKKDNWNWKDTGLVGVNTALNVAAYSVFTSDRANDKQKHLAAGFILGNVSNGLAQLFLPKDMKNRKLFSTLIGFGTAFVFGVAKEVKDSDGSGNVEFNDAFATSMGGLAGTLTISFTDLKKIFKNKKNTSDNKLNISDHELNELIRLEELHKNE
jgi:hypothetical protein